MTQAPTRQTESPTSLLTDFDLYLFNEGTHVRIYEKLGAHVTEIDGTRGVLFAVWAGGAWRPPPCGRSWARAAWPPQVQPCRRGACIW